MKIKFAPLNVPLRRRLQTLCIAIWFVIYVIGYIITLSLVAYILIHFTSYWPFILLYAAWQYYDKDTPATGGREWCLMYYLPVWKYFMEYFPIRLERTVELPPDKNYFFCLYPHGVLCTGAFGNFGTVYSDFKKLFPNLRHRNVTLDTLFKIPLMREVFLSQGGVSSSKESLCYILNSKEKGKSVLLMVGGTGESFYSKPGPSYRIILNSRKGFIKVALATGCSLVPVFSFGEIDVYDQVTAQPGSIINKFQEWFKKQTGMGLLLLNGRGFFQYSFGLLPRRAPITSVVGAPIEVPKIINPTEEEVNKYHEIFTQSLIELFNNHKAKYLKDPEKAQLIIE